MTAKTKTAKKNKSNNGKATFEYRREQAAKLAGVEKDQVGTVRLQLRRLRELGILVDIDVRGTSMFQRSATWAEWGIADEDIRHSRLSGGVKLLIPELYVKRLRSIETRFRQTLEEFSYSEIKAFAPYRWIPATAYEPWRAEWDRLQGELADVKADILRNYDRFTAELIKEFGAIGRRAWRDITAHGYAAVKVAGRTFTTEDEYAAFVASRAAGQMPARAAIESGLLVDYRTAMVADESDVEAELLAAEQIRAERNALRHQVDERERNDYLIDQQLRARVDAMRQAELEHARRRLAEMGSPLDEVVTALRKRILKSAIGMQESVQKSGFVRGKIAEQAAGLLEFFDLMSVGSDEALRTKLYELKAAIGPIGKERTKETPERDIETVRQALEGIIAIAETEAVNATVSSRFDALEI